MHCGVACFTTPINSPEKIALRTRPMNCFFLDMSGLDGSNDGFGRSGSLLKLYIDPVAMERPNRARWSARVI
jgi:hypothetical protein